MGCAERLTRFQEGVNEQFGVEEVAVGFASLDAEARQVGEPLQRDVVGHFEGEEKIVRHFLNKARQIFGGGKLVVGRIHTDGFERLGILCQAIALEPGLGKFPPVVVALFVVDLPCPARVFPARRSNEDVAGGETLNR